jgi:hypothetical protein
VAHASLRCEMQNDIEAFVARGRLKRSSHGDIAFRESKMGIAAQLREPGFLQRRGIIGIEIVD